MHILDFLINKIIISLLIIKLFAKLCIFKEQIFQRIRRHYLIYVNYIQGHLKLTIFEYFYIYYI